MNKFSQNQVLGGAIATLIVASAIFLAPTISRLNQDTTAVHKSPTEANVREFNVSAERVKMIVGGAGTFATIVGGIFLYLNFTVATRNAEIANRNAEIAQKKLEQETQKAEKDAALATARLTSERFSKAVEMLGNDSSIHIRLGGIYALENIANDSKENDGYYQQVMEVLTAFVRERSPWPPKHPNTPDPEVNSEDAIPALPTDIQAVLTVLSRRKYKDTDWETHPLDLRGTDLRNANLNGNHLKKANFCNANLKKANFCNANLEEVKLEGADLEEADLGESNLQGANLKKANLKKANIEGRNLKGANLMGAKLKEANLNAAFLQEIDFRGTDLEKAWLIKVDLQGTKLGTAILQGANLEKANLQEADLQGGKLKQAILRGADLTRANLTGAYLNEANLQGAEIGGAMISFANLKGVVYWNPDLEGDELAQAQESAKSNLQSAQGWETAQYDPEIREWLGLLQENSDAGKQP